MDVRDSMKGLILLGDKDLSLVKRFLEENGFALPMDGERARAWCIAQARAGDVLATYAAAEMFHVGLFGPIDQKRALELCEIAASGGVVPALLLLAELTEDQDENKAVVLMEDAASKGYAPAMYAAALKYLIDGVNQTDKERGVHYLRQAAGLRYAPAQTTLACHLLESGAHHEIREGIEMLQDAAKMESPHANRMLGYFMGAGQYGFKEDAGEAARLKARAEALEAEALRVWRTSARA